MAPTAPRTLRNDRVRRNRLIQASLLACAVLAGSGCAHRAIRNDPVYFPPAPATARVVLIASFNSLHDIVPVKPTFADIIRGGAINPRVATPAGIAIASDHLYICDTHLNVVHDWNLTTGQARRLGASGNATLSKPVDVAVGKSGAVFVADRGRSEVVAFNADGTLRHRLKPPDRTPYKPVAVAIHGSTLYVADIAAHTIDSYSTTDGQHLGTVGGVGSDAGKMYFPMGVATNGDGDLLISDMMNARVQVLDAAGGAKLAFGQPGDRYGDMGKPKHLDVAPDGTIFIADAEFAHIHLYDRDGRLLMLVGGSGDGAGMTPMPLGVAVATSLPARLTTLVPSSFRAEYYFFTTSTIGRYRINLFAVGSGH